MIKFKSIVKYEFKRQLKLFLKIKIKNSKFFLFSYNKTLKISQNRNMTIKRCLKLTVIKI